jgi:hypothetical protein
MTRDELVEVVKDVEDTVRYCQHRQADGIESRITDIWEMIQRTNRNLQRLLDNMLEDIPVDSGWHPNNCLCDDCVLVGPKGKLVYKRTGKEVEGAT